MRLTTFSPQTISDGDASKPVYISQYFDKAYKVDTNGSVTSQETGILSPYGAFQLTEPRPVTGQTQQGIVQSAVNLKNPPFNIGKSQDEHSAFFARPIQTIQPFYIQILDSIRP